MKLRLLLALLLCTASSCAFAMWQPSAVAHAEGECEAGARQVIPGEALDGFAVWTGSSGSYQALGGAVGTVGAGGATTAGTTATLSGTGLTAGGAVAVSAGAFLLAMQGACGVLEGTRVGGTFLDWLTGDGDAVPQPAVIGQDTLVHSGYKNCTYSGTYYGPNIACQAHQWPSAGQVPTGAYLWHNAIASTWHSGAVQIPAFTTSKAYPAASAFGINNFHSGSSWMNPTNVTHQCNIQATGSLDGSMTSNGCFNWAGVNAVEVIQPYCTGPGSTAPTLSRPGIGGFCGQNPGKLLFFTSGNVASSLIVSVFAADVDLQQRGWWRNVETHVRCKAPNTSGSGTWVKAESEPYRDRFVESLIRTPECPVGQMPVEVISRRVPLNYNCTLGIIAGSGSCVADNIITRVLAPASMTGTSGAPDWSFCLTFGANCGQPELDGATCIWGGYTVPSSYCSPGTQVGDPAVAPEAVPKSTPTIAPVPYEPNEPQDTRQIDGSPNPDPDPEPNEPTINVNIPIDEGDGDCGGAQGCITTEEFGGDDDECWPSGWGWFNPAQWVLRPIKCALLWAFVPGDGLGQSFDEFKESTFEQFPFSLVALAADFMGELGGAMQFASGSGCFGGSSSWSFGDYGSVDAGAVCIGDDVTVSSGQRQTLTVLMLAPMVYGLLVYTWGMVLGGKRQAVVSS